ncbi:unnamed protein product [Arabidopsis lyrata]|uniref:Expressed protein n=1 Tax=Arabidopsis lyrata subsp. lyrata TaxID=81972 RepID=D7M537_ARALL|nr:expressed protein [Arabidopsis lyrata subsp. lyrata]EFH47790.1 expressed protein [Arabidopsis lyrata subsp. lyrata]CAH8270908.1 unnamed protein product [Arabidopsis lyrata]
MEFRLIDLVNTNGINVQFLAMISHRNRFSTAKADVGFLSMTHPARLWFHPLDNTWLG